MPSITELHAEKSPMQTQLPGPSSRKPERDLQSHLSSFDNVPLFMKDLPVDGTEDTTAIDALQSLTFDGTPDEVATNFKNQGNEYFVAKRYKEARGFYTQGLDAYPKDEKLHETLLINRAACNLELENFGMTLKGEAPTPLFYRFQPQRSYNSMCFSSTNWKEEHTPCILVVL